MAKLRSRHDCGDGKGSVARVQAKRVKECKKEGALKELVGRDLRKMRRTIVSRVRDFQQLHDMVKNQRNRFVNLIQAARQGIAELREKQKIVTNELDILRNESSNKDAALEDKRTEVQAAVAERNGLRAKLNKLGTDFRARHSKVDEQIAQIDKLNGIINASEKDMMRLKKQYEARASAAPWLICSPAIDVLHDQAAGIHSHSTAGGQQAHAETRCRH
jgi:chromosome segregation ATPase